MRRARLSYKVFWATLIGLMLFIILWMVLQTKFFETFYTHQKSNELSQQFEDIYMKYADGRIALNVKPNEVKAFEQQFYGLTAVLYKRGNTIDVYTGGYTAAPAIPIFPAIPLDPSSKPPSYELRVHTSASPSSKSPAAVTDMEKLMPSIPASFSGVSDEQLSLVLNLWLQNNQSLNSFSKQGAVSVEKITGKDSKDSNGNMLIAAAKLPGAVNHLGGDAYFIALATLQPVGDAVQVMSQFYGYFYALAVLLILLFSFFFSRTISKPLVQLNKLATQLAKLDFSAAVRINRKDEIGQLAQTMNHLALKLQLAMDDLQEANAKLVADIEKEKQHEQLRKQFVASVSHELKTPVSLIQGYAEALKDNVGQGVKRDKYAGIIIEESYRMARLVSDLLDLSQLESGRFALQWSPVPFQETLRSVLTKLAPHLKEKSIQLDWVGQQAEELWIRSDRQRLEQVLINLIENAIRHMPVHGHLAIRVTQVHSSIQVTPVHSAIQVEISNEGPPITEADLPYIWDTFYRADRSGSREFGGTGIGLSIVKAILQRHRSEYGVRNDDDGVTFYFTLPLELNE